MTLLNKEKMMKGFEKTVDTINDTADRAGRYAKEKEWDKKIDHAAKVVEDSIREIGRGLKETFSSDSQK